MSRKALAILVLSALWLTTSPADAEIGAVDDRPAATLLLPYFEVDVDDPTGLDTLFSINNAAAEARVVHVTLWTDLGVPTIGFNVYLTGYDVVPISLRQIFKGNLPQTSLADPPGAFSLPPTVPPAGCVGQLPPPPLSPADVSGLRNAHSGKASSLLAGLCGGLDRGDGRARGYVTVDAMNECSTIFPDGAGYFVAGGVGKASNDNVLWGDYFYIDRANAFAQGENLVHIEASKLNPETATPGEYTFYGRYVAWLAADNREALASKTATRFLVGGVFDTTRLIVWRDSKVDQGPVACPASPAPLPYEDIYVFDEQENPYSMNMGAVKFDALAGVLDVGGAEFPVPVFFGWIYLNLNHGGGGNPPEDPDAAQSVAATTISALGRFSVGQKAYVLESALNASHACINGGGMPPCP